MLIVTHEVSMKFVGVIGMMAKKWSPVMSHIIAFWTLSLCSLLFFFVHTCHITVQIVMKSTLICFWLNSFTFDANQTKHSFLILMLIAKDEKFNSFWGIKVHNKSSSIECLWCMFSRQQFLISHPCACFWANFVLGRTWGR